MSLPIYKPNAANKGSAFTFNFGPAKKGGDLKGDLALYVSTVLQASWNSTTKQGSFKENAKNQAKTCNIKLSLFEVGGLINSIKRRVEFKGYHTFPGSSSSIQFSFAPAVKEEVFNGFIFSILRGSDKAVFRIGIAPNEAEVLSNFLDFGLKQHFANKFRTQFSGPTQQAQAPAAKPVEAAPEETEGNPFGEEGSTVKEVEEPQVEAGTPEAGSADENPFG